MTHSEPARQPAPPQADPADAYRVRRESQSLFLSLRGRRLHLRQWGHPSSGAPALPPLVLLHGWMDVSASFQFLVDALDAAAHAHAGPGRCILAPDWRGFGLSEGNRGGSYWFADYLADLEAMLDSVLGREHPPIDLLGHSLGANVALAYAGVRPERIRKLINLEGFGLPPTKPDQAPGRYARWLDSLSQEASLRSYASLEEVADRLVRNNPRLERSRARWLAGRWAQADAQGRWHLLADPAHKRPHGHLYREDETLACWRAIRAPVLYLEGSDSEMFTVWKDSYPKAAIAHNLAQIPELQTQVISPAGHMLHHDQPEQLAAHILAFLDRR